jgi:hypothetical protein
MILYIDTTDFNQVIFALAPSSPPYKGGARARPGLNPGGGFKIKKQIYKIDPHQSHKTLEKLDEFLKISKYPISSIKKIIVNKGPGSYTGVRVGVTHALALGLAWKVPVKAIAKDKFVIV